MSSITPSQIADIARLARLGLSAEESQRAAQDIGGILNHFAQIQNISTTDVPTSDDVTGLTNVIRKDTAQQNDLCDADTLLQAAPQLQDRHVKVSAVF